MPLSPGTRLGVYEVVGPLGAGGMGEVYRARDSRLGRDVAIKVLPAALATDPDALARFEREMKTLAALSHPQIIAIYDVGREGSTAYAVTELLDGHTLAEIVSRGPVPIRKAVEYGVQIARALAAAHDRGIVHRDLKPANVFVTKDGHVKVLDFGLARATAPADDAATTANTSPGLVMGTVGYMAPEQARGLAVDHRADVFAFGCLMYELVSGKRAFDRDSAADTISAILKEDPPPLSGANVAVPPALDRVIHRCLEKNPDERFQSARDLAFALETLSTGVIGPVSGPSSAARPRNWRGIAAAAAIVAALAAAFLIGRGLAPADASSPMVITRLTYDRGVIRNARFAPDGQTVVYGARWHGRPLKMYVARTDSGQSKPLDLPEADVVAVSSTGDMLLSLGRRYLSSWTGEGTLARSALFGSSVRELLEHVRDADFMPADRLAIARRVNGRDRLEVPQGNVVFETPGYISGIRVAPDGTRVAFLEHPLYGDNRGYLALFDGKATRRLTPEYGGIETVAWLADGREIWYGATSTEAHWPIRAIDPDVTSPRDGRIVWYVPSDLLLLDIDARGRVLLTGNEAAGVMAAKSAGDLHDRNLSEGHWTLPGSLSRDGRTLLASEMDASANYSILVRRMDASAPVRIGSGRAQELSADGKWALSITPAEPRQVIVFPTGAGESRTIDVGTLVPNAATFVQSGAKLGVAVVGARADVPEAVVADLSSGKTTSVPLPELRGNAFSQRRFLPARAAPDGSLLAIQADDGKVLAWPLPNGGPARELAALGENETFVGWPADAGHIYVASWNGPKARVDSIDLSTRRRSTVREIEVEDPAGMLTVPELFLSADAQSYVYGFSRMLSNLYLVTGLR